MNGAQNNRIQAEALTQTMIKGGVAGAIVSPGSRNTPLVLALDDARDALIVESILDERTAGFFALGLARASGRPVVLCCTSGTAGAHYLPAVIEAAQSNIPLLLLTADRPEELHGMGAPQTVPQQDLFKPHVRWATQLSINDMDVDGKQMEDLIRVALEVAEGPIPGPVHLNIPFAEPLWEPESGVKTLPMVSEETWKNERDSLQLRDLDTAKEILNKAQRGVILCGHRELLPGEVHGQYERAVTGLAQKLQWPIIAEPGSGLRFGEHTRDKVADFGDLLLRSEVFATSARPDCVLQLGRAPLSKPTLRWLNQLSWQEKLIVPIPGQYGSHFYRTGWILESEDLSLLGALNEAIPSREGSAWGDLWPRAERAVSAALEPSLNSTQLWEGQVAHTLVQELPEQTRLFVGNSMPGRDMNSYGGGRSSALTFWANRGANGIDGNLATLFGSAQFNPDQPHVALVGDLAFLHDIGSLIQRASKADNVTVVVVDNGGGNIFSHLPIAAHPDAFERRFLTPPDVGLDELLKGLPINYASVDTLCDLQEMLHEMVKNDRFSVLRAEVDRKFSLGMHEQAITTAMNAVKNAGAPV
jgi:2-succinyl-5-enolpyruvyl-6-hydroxy-3-cyclohexene-1-carboxylate synthase